jgi:hypothetical protein
MELECPTAGLYMTLTQSLHKQNFPGLSRDEQGIGTQILLFSFLISGPSTCLLSPPMADSWPFKFASGGAGTYTKPLKHAQRLQLLGRPVFGLVGIQFGWECSPTTFGSVTTSYLVHGKKAIH